DVPDLVPLDERKLNDHSRSFAQMLFSARPDWKEFATMASPGAGDQMFLVVTVDPPKASMADHPLIIDTGRDEITAGFDFCHAHFGWPNDRDFEVDNALRFIADIVEEKRAAVSLWAGEKWVLSTTLDVSTGEALLDHVPEGATLRKIRSWKGTYSRNEV